MTKPSMSFIEPPFKRTSRRVWRFVSNGMPTAIKAYIKRVVRTAIWRPNEACKHPAHLAAEGIIRESQKHRRRGNLAKAERIIDRAIKSHPDTIGFAIEYAEIATVEKDHAKALSRWSNIIHQFGDLAPLRAWLALSRLLRETENFDAAHAVLQRGMSIHPHALASFEKEAIRLASDARWPPPTLNSWCGGAQGGVVECASSQEGVHRSFYVASTRTESVLTPKFRHNEHVVQACAFGGIRLCHNKARAAIRWADACRQTWLEEEVKLESSWPTQEQAWKTDFIDNFLARTVNRVIGKLNPERQLTLGISSGYDSRALLYVLRKARMPLSLFTFGQIGDCDYDFITWLSSQHALDVRCFDTSEIEWSLEKIDNYIHYTQNYPISPVMPVTLSMNELVPRRVELHGNFGDSLTSGPPLSTLNHTWQQALRVFCRKANVFALQRLFPAEQVASFLSPEPLIDGTRLSYAKQLDIGYLDAQRVQPLNGLEMEYATPFRDARWVGFWLNRTPQELENRALWIQFLQAMGTPEFVELKQSYASHEGDAKSALAAFLYGSDDKEGVIDFTGNTKELPSGKHMHFCFYACYANNASFRRLVNASIRRLKSRGIFQQAFVDDLMCNLEAKTINAGRMVNGLVTIDVMAEAQLLFE